MKKKKNQSNICVERTTHTIEPEQFPTIINH